MLSIKGQDDMIRTLGVVWVCDGRGGGAGRVRARLWRGARLQEVVQ